MHNYIRFKGSRWDLRLGFSSLNSCQTWDLKSEQLSDFGSQGARIQDPRSNMFKKLFLDPEQKSWIQMGLLDPRFSNTSFSKSWILDPDPRFLPWIQEKFFEHLGSWILTMSDLRFSNLNSFQTWDSSHRNWSKTKNKAWVSNKNII